MASLNYTATEETMNGEFKPVPPATYLATITQSEMKKTKAGNGDIIKLTFEIMDGEYKGRLFFNNINFNNPSSDCQNIGRKELNTIMKACELYELQDTSQLHGTAMMVDVVIEESVGYKPQNVPKNYASASEEGNNQAGSMAADVAQAEKATQAAAPTTGASTKPSWAK